MFRLEPKGSNPWGAYVAFSGDTEVGECAFKGPPVDGRVEIAYHTYEGFEGRGHATAMARALIAIARHERLDVVVFAQTLPQTNASTALLEKLGFAKIGSVQHPEDGEVWEWQLQ